MHDEEPIFDDNRYRISFTIDDLKLVLNMLKKNGFKFNMPDSLYRYRSTKHITDDLEKETAHLSLVSNYPDPFEFTYSIKSMMKAIDLSEGVEEYDWLSEIASDFLKNKTRVCCFSETYRSFAMWNHYSDGHKGYCIEYDLELDSTQFVFSE